MITLDYTGFSPRVRQLDQGRQVFDPVRKAWVALTPEEWVRQHLIFFLTEKRNYPMAYLAVEKGITVGTRTKRFDLLVYDKLHQPWLAMECKAMHVKLDDSVLDQLLVYNQTLMVKWLAITNGTTCALFAGQAGALNLQRDFPIWE